VAPSFTTRRGEAAWSTSTTLRTPLPMSTATRDFERFKIKAGFRFAASDEKRLEPRG
jgi:hypothetical protein